MASFDLEITKLSVESLVMPNKSKKKNTVFVSVNTNSNSNESKWQNASTCMVDMAKAETSATWDESLKVSVPMHGSHVTFELQLSRKSMFTGKSKTDTICTAYVPISDLVEGHVSRNCVRFLSYRLRDKNMESIGIVNFSVRVKGLDHDGTRESVDRRWWSHQATTSSGVVIGIPAAWCL